MSLRKIKFGNKEINKKEFYSSKEAILLDFVDLSKIVVPRKLMIKHINIFVDLIKPLCAILPQMNGYIKYFDDGGKNMSFVTDDENVYGKYNEIWEVITNLLTIDFTVNPVRDDIYLVAKLKIFNKINKTTFTNNAIPMEKK